RASGFITRPENLRKLTPEYKAIALAHMYIVWDDLDQYLDYEVDEDEYYAIATELLELLIYGYLNVADSQQVINKMNEKNNELKKQLTQVSKKSDILETQVKNFNSTAE